MSTIILDCGSANTCKNDKAIVSKMIREIAAIDSARHNVILKWQLFQDAPPNIPLDHDVFKYAYDLAGHYAFQTTASVFDIESLRFLMTFKVPFIKIACRPDLYHLAQYSTVPVYISSASSGLHLPCEINLACVRKYPASLESYEATFTKDELMYISDHTVGWGLFEKYTPKVIEKHYVHIREEGNPDAGPFAVTPEDLRAVL
jgi:sialic acid synthase SpsE